MAACFRTLFSSRCPAQNFHKKRKHVLRGLMLCAVCCVRESACLTPSINDNKIPQPSAISRKPTVTPSNQPDIYKTTRKEKWASASSVLNLWPAFSPIFWFNPPRLPPDFNFLLSRWIADRKCHRSPLEPCRSDPTNLFPLHFN